MTSLAIQPYNSFKFFKLSNHYKILGIRISILKIGNLTNVIMLFPFLATILYYYLFLWLTWSCDRIMQRNYWGWVSETFLARFPASSFYCDPREKLRCLRRWRLAEVALRPIPTRREWEKTSGTQGTSSCFFYGKILRNVAKCFPFSPGSVPATLRILLPALSSPASHGLPPPPLLPGSPPPSPHK